MSTRLNWGDTCPVRSVELRELIPGQFEAVLHASAKIENSNLVQLRQTLRQHGMTTLLDKRNGEDVLIARGLHSEAALLSTLQQSGCVNGEVTRAAVADPPAPPKRANTRFLSALFYDLGNLAFIISGIQRGRHNPGGKFTMNDISELMVGVTFSVGDVLMTCFSQEHGDERAQLTQGFEEHLRKHGITLPPPQKLTPKSLHDSGAMVACTDYIRNNMISIKCLTEGVAGLFMINAATKKGDFNASKLAAGLLVSTGWFSTFLVDRFAPPRPDAGNGLIDKIRENPRGLLARPAAMGNNLANLHGAYHERKKFYSEVRAAEQALIQSGPGQRDAAMHHLALAQRRQHDYAWNVLSACSFMVANYLFGISEKSGKPKSSEEEQRIAQELVTLSANTLLQLPPQMRKLAIIESASYIAEQSHTKQSQQQIAQAIEEKLEGIAHSRFIGNGAQLG